MPVAPPRGRRQTLRFVLPLALCGTVVSLMQTLVLPLLPDLPRLLDATALEVTYLLTSTLLVAVVAMPVAGRLGDMVGKRRVLLACMGCVAAGCALTALADGIWLAVAGRALQGAALGAVPLCISILREVLPPHRAATGTAVVSATLGLGAALGFPAAALVAERAPWQALFWCGAALGLACLLLVRLLVPESVVRSPARFDLSGALWLTTSLVPLVLVLSTGDAWGWTSPATLGSALVAALAAVAFVRHELRTPAPLVDLRVAAGADLGWTNGASALAGFAMYGNALTLPLLLMTPRSTGYGFGVGMVEAGLVLLPSGLVMMGGSVLSARLSRTRGPRVALISGLLVVAAAYAAAMVATDTAAQVMLVAIAIGAGVGLAYGAMPALVMQAVPLSATAAANGVNSLMRALGTTASTAVLGAVLAHDAVQVGAVTVPREEAFQVAFVVSVVVSLLAAAVATRTPRAPRPAVAPAPVLAPSG